MVVIFLISDLTWSFGAVFVSCELCQRATDACDDIRDDIDQFKWYLFPSETWKMLLQIHTNQQKPAQFQCIRSIKCERIAFKNVSILEHTVFTVTDCKKNALFNTITGCKQGILILYRCFANLGNNG